MQKIQTDNQDVKELICMYDLIRNKNLTQGMGLDPEQLGRRFVELQDEYGEIIIDNFIGGIKVNCSTLGQDYFGLATDTGLKIVQNANNENLEYYIKHLTKSHNPFVLTVAIFSLSKDHRIEADKALNKLQSLNLEPDMGFYELNQHYEQYKHINKFSSQLTL